MEEALTESYSVEEYHCERQSGGCGMKATARHSSKIKTINDRHFLVVLLRRVTQGQNGVELNMNKISATGDVEVVSKNGIYGTFSPIAVIEHSGEVILSGDTRGHYMCDLKTKDGQWYHTNDDCLPKKIDRLKVSRKAAVVLYCKKSR